MVPSSSDKGGVDYYGGRKAGKWLKEDSGVADVRYVWEVE
jgi:hypothetical protein